jgi:tripartite-type tricarboxylate transporter receptor subunit TctC
MHILLRNPQMHNPAATMMGVDMRPHLMAVVLVAGCITDATALDWPTRPVTMVVTAAAGSSSDVLGRILGVRLSQILGHQVVIENVGGAGGLTGAARVAKATPDGYQFLLGNPGTQAISQSISNRPLYNSATDFAPVALLVEQAVVLVARKDLPAGTLPEFIAHARSNRAKMQFGSPGAGGFVHLACAMLNTRIGVDIAHIPYRGGGPAMQDLIAGRIDYQCVIASLAIPQIESGEVKAIAILTRGRSPVLPSLASAHEQGLSDFETVGWSGFFAPRRTPAAIVQRLSEASIATIETPSVQEQLAKIGATVAAPERRSPAHLDKLVASEIERWRAVVSAIGLSTD